MPLPMIPAPSTATLSAALASGLISATVLRGLDPDWEAAELPEHRVALPVDGVLGELHVGEALGELWEDGRRLEPRERGAEAVVGAVRERLRRRDVAEQLLGRRRGKLGLLAQQPPLLAIAQQREHPDRD